MGWWGFWRRVAEFGQMLIALVALLLVLAIVVAAVIESTGGRLPFYAP